VGTRNCSSGRALNSSPVALDGEVGMRDTSTGDARQRIADDLDLREVGHTETGLVGEPISIGSKPIAAAPTASTATGSMPATASPSRIGVPCLGPSRCIAMNPSRTLRCGLTHLVSETRFRFIAATDRRYL
jgi:hypothetical protein